MGRRRREKGIPAGSRELPGELMPSSPHLVFVPGRELTVAGVGGLLSVQEHLLTIAGFFSPSERRPRLSPAGCLTGPSGWENAPASRFCCLIWSGRPGGRDFGFR